MAQNKNSQIPACGNMEQDLVLYYYSELDDPQRTQVKIHIEHCAGCRLYLDEMAFILPLTEKIDEPPQIFWDNYTREVRQKLATVRDRQPWWRGLATFFQPWAVPAFATAAVVALALTLTLGKGFWRTQEGPPDDEAFMEVLPVAENLEFFQNMEVLDAMDFLESGGANKGTT